MWNLTFKSPPAVVFFAAVNHNWNICMLAINGLWKTKTYKNNKMDRNPPITVNNVTFWPRNNGPWKTETFKMDRNPPITAKESDFLTPLNSFYSFSKTSAMLIDGSENTTVRGDLNFRFRMLLKGTIIRPNLHTLSQEKHVPCMAFSSLLLSIWSLRSSSWRVDNSSVSHKNSITPWLL